MGSLRQLKKVSRVPTFKGRKGKKKNISNELPAKIEQGLR